MKKLVSKLDRIKESVQCIVRHPKASINNVIPTLRLKGTSKGIGVKEKATLAIVAAGNNQTREVFPLPT